MFWRCSLHCSAPLECIRLLPPVVCKLVYISKPYLVWSAAENLVLEPLRDRISSSGSTSAFTYLVGRHRCRRRLATACPRKLAKVRSTVIIVIIIYHREVSSAQDHCHRSNGDTSQARSLTNVSGAVVAIRFPLVFILLFNFLIARVSSKF